MSCMHDLRKLGRVNPVRRHRIETHGMLKLHPFQVRIVKNTLRADFKKWGVNCVPPQIQTECENHIHCD